MTSDRLETMLSGASPELRQHISDRIAKRDLPRPLREAVSDAAAEQVADDSAPLETVIQDSALEAIVQRTGRPPLLIRNDQVELEPLVDFPPDTGAKLVGLNAWIPSVGRVEFLNHRLQWGGTGWVVDQKNGAYLVVTNRHVAKVVAKRVASGAGAFLRSENGPRFGARIDFREEVGSVAHDASRTVDVSEITYLADDMAADMAVLRVKSSPFAITPLQLSDREAVAGQLVALIGYPAFDSRNDVNDQARYFRDLYNVKRMAPGKVMQALSANTTLSHDCTSLGGNSGSPLFALDNRKVVGLHFSGRYGIANAAVGVRTIKKVLAGTSTRVAGGFREGAEGLSDGHHDASVFAGRKGFETAFLDKGAVPTPWPVLSQDLADRIAQPSDDPSEPGELRYTHFGVKFLGDDKLPVMTAVNIDGESAVRIKRGQDKWFTDGRIDRTVQLGASNFADLEIDRGHMVRREDPNWGDPATAAQANDDTFHYVNAAAQHSRLNQGKTLWQGLENYILDSSRTHGFRACVFTGPVLGGDDSVIDGARVPEEFWKLVATLDESGTKLRATAYVLSQGQLIRDLLGKRSMTEANEGAVIGEYRTFQIAVADLAEATGYDFSAYEEADPLRRDGDSEGAEAVRVVPMEEMADMVL